MKKGQQGVAGYAPQVARPQNADVGATKTMETTITAKVANRMGVVALMLSLIPIVLMGAAHTARYVGQEHLRGVLAPIAFLSQAGFVLLNWWILSPLVLVFALISIVRVMRSKVAFREIGFAVMGVGMVLVADILGYVTVNYWAK